MPDQASAANREFIEQQRKRLEALRKQLLGGEKQTLADERQSAGDQGKEAEEMEEKAQRAAENEIRQALHNVDDQKLRAVERALQKIGEGTYGFSDLSGKPIPKARLEASPEAVLTVQEEEQKEGGH